MKLLYVFKERAPIFIELARRAGPSSPDAIPDEGCPSITGFAKRGPTLTACLISYTACHFSCEHGFFAAYVP